MIPGGVSLGTEESGKKIFFWNALPGEKVTDFEIIKTKSSFTEAIATNVINDSDFRVVPRDEHFLSTSPWQIMDFGYEQKTKAELVVEIFREHGIEIETPEIFTDSCDYFYRNKMEYALYWDNDADKISLAFHVRGSHRKIPVKHSSIERPEIFAAAQKIVDDLNARHEEARKYQSLLLRCNQIGEVSGGLFENGKPHPVFKNLTDTILGHEYSYSPNGFFQINLPVYEMVLTEIKKHITTDKVLDLYAGVGTIGLSVARDKKLTLVEVDKSAYSEMLRNVAMANKHLLEGPPERGSARMSGARPWRRDGRTQPERSVFGAIDAILDKSENVTDYIEPDQTVILDPPRAGCDKKLIEKLLEITPEKIVYLSCNPATQARDIKFLMEKYHIDTTKIYNFFPHTPHIESLFVLSLNDGQKKTNIHN